MYPALTVSEILNHKGHTLLWVGSEGGMEKELVERTGWTLEYIESLPVGRLHEWLQINDAKARNAASRKGGR